MFILSSISSWLGFWSVNHNSIYKNSKSKVFKNIKFLGEMSNKWAYNSLGINVYNTFKSQCSWQCRNELILLQ